MRPRASVEVVRAAGHPRVIDDADLRVHVDRRTCVILEVIHGEPVATGFGQDLHRGQLSEAVRRPAQAPVLVGESGDNGDDSQLRSPGQRSGKGPRHNIGPEVLVFDVHQPGGSGEGTLIRTRDRALAVDGEWEGWSLRRIRSEYLHLM